MASATADQAAVSGGAGRAVLRRALLTTLLAMTLATCAAGWLFKAHCLFDGGWSRGEQYTTGCYSDAVPFWDLREVGAGKLPYFQARMEYPVLTGALIYVDGRITKGVFGAHAHPPEFLAVVTLVNTLLALIVTWLLWLIGLSAARLRLWALSPLLVLYVGHNWDLLAIALAVGALALAERGLLARAAALAALGGAAKLFPLYLLPLLALRPLLERRVALVAAMVAAAVIAWGLVNLPVAALAYVNWSEFYAFSGARGGTAASFWELAGQFGWLTTSIAERNLWSGLSFLAGGGAIVAAGWRWQRDRPWLLITPVVLWFLLVNKVYSPQFDLWVYPLMLISARRLTPVRLFVVGDFLAYFAEFWLFAGQETGWPATGQGAILAAATFRAGAMLWIIGDAVTAPPPGDERDGESGTGKALRWIASAIGAYMTAGMTDRSPLAPAAFPTLPDIAGVTPHVARARYKEWDRCDLTFVTLDPGTSVAGVLTQSRCPSPEVEWCRKALVLGQARALVVNAGNSNAFTGSRGRAAVETIAARAAGHLGCLPSDIFIASTGVIGVPLPIDRAEAGLDAAFAAAPCSWEDAATAIGTTDTFAKAAIATALVDGHTVSLVGIVKGSGMIAPDMATMLGFVFTDAAVDPVFLHTALADANAKSFSCITVDGDTSTSDSVLAFATGRAGNAPLAAPDDAGADAFRAALADLCLQLAHLVVRDGEGATKFVRIDVTGAESDTSAHRIALSIANSPLVKTAIAGGDANWGRVVMAVGKAGEPAERDRLAIRFGDTQVARDGVAVEGYDEAPVAAHLQGSEIEIGVDLGLGEGRATAWTCDLTHGYIAINADYRS